LSYEIIIHKFTVGLQRQTMGLLQNQSSSFLIAF